MKETVGFEIDGYGFGIEIIDNGLFLMCRLVVNSKWSQYAVMRVIENPSGPTLYGNAFSITVSLRTTPQWPNVLLYRRPVFSLSN